MKWKGFGAIFQSSKAPELCWELLNVFDIDLKGSLLCLQETNFLRSFVIGCDAKKFRPLSYRIQRWPLAGTARGWRGCPARLTRSAHRPRPNHRALVDSPNHRQRLWLPQVKRSHTDHSNTTQQKVSWFIFMRTTEHHADWRSFWVVENDIIAILSISNRQYAIFKHPQCLMNRQTNIVLQYIYSVL